VLIGCAGIGLWQKNTLSAWYRVWMLQSAASEKALGYVKYFDDLGLVGTNALVGSLQSTNETACGNTREVLAKLLEIWGPNDPRRKAVVQQLADFAPNYSATGQKECFTVLQRLMQDEANTREIQNALSFVISQQPANSATRLCVYEPLIQALQHEEIIESALLKQAKSLVIVGIKCDQEAVRLAAIRLAVLPGLQLQEHLIPLLSVSNPDPSMEVRQLALLALGEHEKLLSTDDLCFFLNDPDKEVRTIVERVLQVRGLSKNQIKLARMMNDPSAVNRAELPGLLTGTTDVDSYQWMERLIRDPSPAVRAAAARSMGTGRDSRMSTLLKTLAEQDSDQTVQQIARFYAQP